MLELFLIALSSAILFLKAVNSASWTLLRKNSDRAIVKGSRGRERFLAPDEERPIPHLVNNSAKQDKGTVSRP